MNSVVAVVQMISGADLDTNLQAASRLIAEASRQGANLVLLPEVFAVLEGGPMRQYGEVEGDGPIQAFLAEQALKNQITLVGGTIPLISRPGVAPGAPGYLVDRERVRPACLVFDAAGKQCARYDKIHLFDVTVADQQASYSESRSYEPGNELVVTTTAGGALGLSVCYDLRFPELYRGLVDRGAEIITVPAAFTRVTGEAHWETLLRARAIETQSFILAAAQGGRHNERRETWGHSMIIDPWGNVLASLDMGEGVAVSQINLEQLREVRERMPISQQRKL